MCRGLGVCGLAVVLAVSGCGGIISTVFIVQGTVSLAGARAANAENLATYEYVSAEAYLKKAREAHSYADFEHSLRFARLAAERAVEAKRKAAEANKPLEPTAPPPESPPADGQGGAPAPTAPPPANPQQPGYQPPPTQPPPAQPQPGQPPPAPPPSYQPAPRAPGGAP